MRFVRPIDCFDFKTDHRKDDTLQLLAASFGTYNCTDYQTVSIMQKNATPPNAYLIQMDATASNASAVLLFPSDRTAVPEYT